MNYPVEANPIAENPVAENPNAQSETKPTPETIAANQPASQASNPATNQDPTQKSTKKPFILSNFVDESERPHYRIKTQNKPGPASPEAKDRVKYNAVRHGFTAQVLIMTPEEHDAFAVFAQAMMIDMAPVGIHETFLANSIAEEAWRLNQMRARSSNIAAVGDIQGAGNAFSFPGQQNTAIETAVIDTAVSRDRAKELSLLSTYMQRTQRSYEKYKEDLHEMQAERKAHHAAEMEEARLLYQLAETQGLPYQPAEDGFVFSLEEIKLHTDRHYKLLEAKRVERDYQEKRNRVEYGRHKAKAA